MCWSDVQATGFGNPGDWMWRGVRFEACALRARRSAARAWATVRDRLVAALTEVGYAPA